MTEAKRTKIAYDFDGTLCTENHSWWSDMLWKLFPYWWCKTVHKMAKRSELQFIPGSFIITGRMGVEYWDTMKQIRKWKLDADLVVEMEKDKPSTSRSIKFKVRKLQELGIEEYYENSEDVIRVLRKKLPNLKVHQIKTYTK